MQYPLLFLPLAFLLGCVSQPNHTYGKENPANSKISSSSNCLQENVKTTLQTTGICQFQQSQRRDTVQKELGSKQTQEEPEAMTNEIIENELENKNSLSIGPNDDNLVKRRLVMDLQDYANLATALGVPFGLLALFFTGMQLRKAKKIENGRFMLELERMIAVHDETHHKLRPGGDWTRDNSKGGRKAPETAKDWLEVEDYMGFFEHCEFLLKTGLLELSSFKALYGYRVINILANRAIVDAKLVEEGHLWQEFRNLTRRLGINLTDYQKDVD